jgi:hypothetical protein
VDGPVEGIGIIEGAVGQLVLLEVAPAAFDVVQFRRVFRQPFDGQPWSGGQSLGGDLAGMDRTVVEHDDQGAGPLSGAIGSTDQIEQGDEIGGALCRTGVHQEASFYRVPRAQQCPLPRLTGSLDAKVCPRSRPAAGQIGMGQRFRLVQIQQVNVASSGLLFQQLEAYAAALDGGGILASGERVARAPPAISFLRKRTDSQGCDTRPPPRRSISAHSRGSVQ